MSVSFKVINHLVFHLPYDTAKKAIFGTQCTEDSLILALRYAFETQIGI